ncbi:MAG: GDSL-type esterase/lipase family protein [Peptococcaceae bacterium]|nr:GDSL-type esterase/lipase family protein [Peptococcaceae bacterium]
MRVYRTGMRVIQISSGLSVIIFALAFFIWGSPAPPPLEQTSESLSSEQDDPSTPEQAPVVVCLGDSYTYGFPIRTNIENDDGSWPKYMQEALGDGVEVSNEGRKMQTSDDLLERFEVDVSDRPGRKPKMVVIFAGMGDALSTPSLSVDAYKDNIQQLVQKAQNRDIIPVLVMPFSYPDDDVQRVIKQYREWLKTYAEDHAVQVVDFQEMLCDEEGIKRQYTDSSAQYPNEDGYKAMGKYMAEQIGDEINS